MRPCMGGIMGMTEFDLGNDLFGDFEEVFLRAFSDFPGRQGGGGMRQKDVAQAILKFTLLNDAIQFRGEIHNIF